MLGPVTVAQGSGILATDILCPVTGHVLSHMREQAGSAKCVVPALACFKHNHNCKSQIWSLSKAAADNITHHTHCDMQA